MAGVAERLEEGSLVLQTLPLDQLGECVLSPWARATAECDGNLELRQMLTGCEVAEIRRGEQELPAVVLHLAIILQARPTQASGQGNHPKLVKLVEYIYTYI